MVNASFKNKTALQLARVGRYADALSILESSNNKLQKNDSYWNIYGNILMAKKQYRLALEKLIIAQTLSSDPDIFINTAYCYEKLNLFDSAKANYITAKNIEPILMAPSFRLMNLYLKTKDTASAINMADELLNKQPKIESTETAFYKREAVTVRNINYKQ